MKEAIVPNPTPPRARLSPYGKTFPRTCLKAKSFPGRIGIAPMAEAHKNPPSATTTLTTPIAPTLKLFSSQTPKSAPTANAQYEPLQLQELQSCTTYHLP